MEAGPTLVVDGGADAAVVAVDGVESNSADIRGLTLADDEPLTTMEEEEEEKEEGLSSGCTLLDEGEEEGEGEAEKGEKGEEEGVGLEESGC